MKITGKYSVAYFLKFGIDFILLVNVLTLICLPFLLNYLYENPASLSYGTPYETNESFSSPDAVRNPKTFPENSKWILSTEIPQESFGFMLGFLYFSGASTAAILIFLRKVMKNLQKDIILDHTNARSFKYLSISCLGLVASFIVKIFFYNTFLTIFCFFIFIILGLFSLVLSEVFRQGAVIREENELTI